MGFEVYRGGVRVVNLLETAVVVGRTPAEHVVDKPSADSATKIALVSHDLVGFVEK